jgi:uncharacterized Ntn-hydrolase superfamily protein
MMAAATMHAGRIGGEHVRERLAATFSIVACDAETGDLGVAVQSKFFNVRPVVPWAKAGVGAIATQSLANPSYGPRGLDLLEQGVAPGEAVRCLTDADVAAVCRQVGVVDARGRAATFTGQGCLEWAGGLTGNGFAVQGNILAGAQVVEGMAAAFTGTRGPLAERLLAALEAGQAAGGDRRGVQSAALLVVRANGGYGNFDDRYVDLAVADHADPIVELRRLYVLHRLSFFPADPDNAIPITPDIARDLQVILARRGFYQGPVSGEFDEATRQALRQAMVLDNYYLHMREDDRIDRDLLAVYRSADARRNGG